MVSKGDLLIALYGANSADVGIAQLDGAINQAVLCVKSGESVRYLYFYLAFNQGRIVAKYLQGGQGNLSGHIMKIVKIPIPNRKEQMKIANFLSAIDEKINLVGQQITHMRDFKKGLLQQMFV